MMIFFFCANRFIVLLLLNYLAAADFFITHCITVFLLQEPNEIYHLKLVIETF